MPRSSIPLKNAAYFAVSAVMADVRSRTGWLVKNGVTSEPNAFTCMATPASRAAPASPSASRAPSFARWR